MNEKKRKILLAAMKLFSKKSVHQTSMQQIAEVCGLSKGSLYTHFKSKEELLSDIFIYYYQVLRDQIAAAKQDSDSPQEDFIREMAIRTQHYYAFQEFFLMQMKEIQGLEDPSLNQFVQQENLILKQRMEKRMIEMYGEKIVPYAADLTTSLKGLMISYLREVIEKGDKPDFKVLSLYLFKQLDAVAKMLSDKKPTPFLSSYLKEGKGSDPQEEVHPLHVLKKLKESARREKESVVIMDSIAIIEKELLEVKPRQAILDGMISNLKRSSSIKQLTEELEQSIKKMPGAIYL